VPVSIRDFFAARGAQPAAVAAESADDPLVDIGGDVEDAAGDDAAPRNRPAAGGGEGSETALQQLAKMSFSSV
jgi:hypothetical protein